MSKQNKKRLIEYIDIALPLEYWDERKELLKEVRSWYAEAKMVKRKHCCAIVFCRYDYTNSYYLINSAINLGAFLKSKGYTTQHNPFTFNEKNNRSA